MNMQVKQFGWGCLVLLLGGCGASEPETTPIALPELTPATQPVADVATPPGAGGYEPSSRPRGPSITLSQEELDQQYQEARRNLPVPVAAAPAP